MKNILKFNNIVFTFFSLLLITNLILISATTSKNESSYWCENQKIDLIKNAKSKIQKKLNSEKDVQMITCSYELKGNKLESMQTKVFHTSYRKDPTYNTEEFSLSSNDKNLKKKTVKIIYNKCTDAKHIFIKQPRKSIKIAFNANPLKTIERA